MEKELAEKPLFAETLDSNLFQLNYLKVLFTIIDY